MQQQFLSPTDQRSFCEFKGVATYYILKVGRQVSRCAAWSYHNPSTGYESIRDYVAFYPGRVDACYVDGEASFEPPKPITNITVGVSDPATVGLREVRVWHACGPMEDAFQLLMVAIDQRIVEQGGHAEARVRWRNISQYPFWTNLRLGVHCRGDWYYGDWIYAEAPPSGDATTDVWAPVKANWPCDAKTPCSFLRLSFSHRERRRRDETADCCIRQPQILTDCNPFGNRRIPRPYSLIDCFVDRDLGD